MLPIKNFAVQKNESIEVVSYDPQWPQLFAQEAEPIKQALGSNCLALHHFGSTSVPGLEAKPKIDILAVVKELSKINTLALENLGFENRGEVIASGRYFAKKDPNIHLHVFEEGNPLIERNLLFRDWLRTHQDDREAYAKLKKDLSVQYTDGMAYCLAKTEFINKIIDKAIAEEKKSSSTTDK